MRFLWGGVISKQWQCSRIFKSSLPLKHFFYFLISFFIVIQLQLSAFCNSMDGTGEHYAKRNKHYILKWLKIYTDQGFQRAYKITENRCGELMLHLLSRETHEANRPVPLLLTQVCLFHCDSLDCFSNDF